MAWSEAAREASIEARQAHKKQVEQRTARSFKSYKVSDRQKQTIATQSERDVAASLGATPTRDNDPFDVVFKRGNKTYAVEVKTLIDNTNDKITMHPDSLARKLQWAKANKAVPYTVVVDARQGQQIIYARYGVGSFRLAGLTKTSFKDLPGFIK